MVTRVSYWLLHRAAGRWPAGLRDELLAEWTAEIRTIDRDPDLSAFRRARLMLGFSVSLALSRPGGEPALGWKRISGLVAAVIGYLVMLAVLEWGWLVTITSGSGYRPIIDDPGLGARLVIGAVALLPVLLTALTGRWLGRRFPARRTRPATLGLCLIAVVAAWAGLGFAVSRMNLSITLSSGVPVPSTMAYSFGNQPYGMVTSWLVWLAAFVLLASAVRWAAARRRRIWRVLTATGITTLVAAVAVTAATFVQFGPSTAPRTEMWKWFGLWLVPRHPSEMRVAEGGDVFQTARLSWFFFGSYPHVLLAIAAFGVAFLMATNRQPADVANGFGIESSSNRV